MLVLTRKKNEAVVIGQDIVIEVLEVQGSRVRVGISAPRDIAIRRGELDAIAKSACPVLQSDLKV